MRKAYLRTFASAATLGLALATPAMAQDGAAASEEEAAVDEIIVTGVISSAGQNKIDQGSKVVIDNSIALKLQDATTLQ